MSGQFTTVESSASSALAARRLLPVTPVASDDCTQKEDVLDGAQAAECRDRYPVTIDGPRIRLRDFHDSDLDGCMGIVGDPQVTRYLSFDTRTRDQQATLLAADIARAQVDPRPDYYLAAVEKATETMIGFARLGFARPRTAELGYAIRADRWGKGYATEVSATMLDFGFAILGLHRVQAACGPDNTASQRVLAKLGFQYEGRMRDHVFTNDAWRDSLLYSLLDNERAPVTASD